MTRSNKQDIYLTRAEILEALADLLAYWQNQEPTHYTEIAIQATQDILKGEQYGLLREFRENGII